MRPFPPHAVPRVWSWISAVRDSVVDDFGPSNIEEFMSRWMADRQSMRLAVVDEDNQDQIMALVEVREVNPISCSINVLVPPHVWFTDHAAGAIRACVEHLFRRGYLKVMASVMARSTSLIRALKIAGFHREGTLRRQTLRRGRLEDVALLGVERNVEDLDDAFSVMVTAGAGRWGGDVVPETAEAEQSEQLEPVVQ